MGNPLSAPFEAQFDPDRAQLYVIQSLIAKVHTCMLVEVLAVRPVSGKVGFVDVQPLVLDTSTGAITIAQSPIYNVPYMRYQGGTSAVILDPVEKDIGIATFAEQDITNVKQTQKAGAPATDRMHSTADALYIGGVLNPDPTQYVKFQPSGAGIDIVSPGTINLTTPGNVHFTAAQVVFDADVIFNKNVSSTKTGSGVNTFAAPISAPDVIVPNASLNAHIHNDPQGGVVGPPHN